MLVPGAVERSRERAAQHFCHPEPLRNLRRAGRDPDAPRPTVLVAVPFLIIGGAERLLSHILKHLHEQLLARYHRQFHRGWVRARRRDPWFAEATAEIYHLPRFLAHERWGDFIEYLMRTRAIDVLWIVGSEFICGMLPHLRADAPALRVVDLLFNTVGHTANNHQARCRDRPAVLVESEAVRTWLIAAGEIADRIRVIQSGVDTRVYTPRPRDADILRSLGLAADAGPGRLLRPLVRGEGSRRFRVRDRPAGARAPSRRVPYDRHRAPAPGDRGSDPDRRVPAPGVSIWSAR